MSEDNQSRQAQLDELMLKMESISDPDELRLFAFEQGARAIDRGESCAEAQRQCDFWKTEADVLLWNLAGCSVYATGYQLDGEHNRDLARPALDDVLRLARKHRETERQKNGAYAERNKLVAALSKLFPSSLERHPESDTAWEDDWRWIVFVDLPTGQASWHIHDSELAMFDHLPRNEGRVWDGHTTEQKYARLADLESVRAWP